MLTFILGMSVVETLSSIRQHITFQQTEHPHSVGKNHGSCSLKWKECFCYFLYFEELTILTGLYLGSNS